jgi:hypothetical protein
MWETTASRPTECEPCREFNLARAFDAANMTDSTIAAYERFINTPYFDRLVEVDALGLAGAHKRLGELYEQRATSRGQPRIMRSSSIYGKARTPTCSRSWQTQKRRVARLAAREKR